MSSLRRVLLLLCALATMLVAAVPAGADERRDICATRVALRDSPGGFAIGYLFEPERVRVLQFDAQRRWARVRVRTRKRGWIPVASLCPHDR